MVRTVALWLVVVGFSGYAWKDWWKSCCVLIALIAVVQHPDMPTSVLGIQGLNPWNLLLLNVLGAWAVERSSSEDGVRLPTHVWVMLSLYALVVLIGFFRLLGDRSYLNPADYTTTSIISENFINTFKWPIPGLLMFWGARTRQRQQLTLFAIGAVYLLLAVQVLKWMPLSTATNGDMATRALKIVQKEIGFSRVTVSMLLAGGSWFIFCLTPIAHRSKLLVWAAMFATILAQALTGGRMGYVTWAVIGLALCLVRWRKYLLVAPIVPLVVLQLAPGAMDRMMQGISQDSSRSAEFGRQTAGIDDYQVTSGRTLAWPLVIEKIHEGPYVGFGTEAMQRMGITAALGEEGFPHPHNAYLELLLDSGLIGFGCVIPFYISMLWKAGSLLRDRNDPLRLAVGGGTWALMLALLVAAMGSHSFYPRAWSVGMWAAMGLTLRLRAEATYAGAAVGGRPSTGSKVSTAVDGLITSPASPRSRFARDRSRQSSRFYPAAADRVSRP